MYIQTPSVIMASIAIMLGGAIINAATFIGGNYLAKALSGDSGNVALAEKVRHDEALEAYQKAYEKWQKDRTERLDWIAVQDREKRLTEIRFSRYRPSTGPLQSNTQSKGITSQRIRVL